MRVISLGSGSSGNSLLIEAGPGRRTKLLVDAGFPDSTLIARLRQVGVSPSQLAGVLVTHEHTDHILSLPTLMRRYAVPVIADVRTLGAVEQFVISNTWQAELRSPSLRGSNADEAPPEDGRAQGPPLHRTPSPPLRRIETLRTHSPITTQPSELIAMDRYPDTFLQSRAVMEEQQVWEAATRASTPPYTTPAPTNTAIEGADTSVLGALHRPLPMGSRTVIGDIEVTSFPVSHDAVAPCGYLLRAGGCRVCIVIDSGEVTAAMLEAVHQADLLVLESNHDRERLLRGPYPYALKLRILSSTGHLSNDQAADAVLRTWRTDSVRWLWLSHLSRTNNTPKLALNSMVSRLSAARANLAQVHITVLPPGIGSAWDSTQLWHTPSLWEMQV